jgi:hypothetical protein
VLCWVSGCGDLLQKGMLYGGKWWKPNMIVQEVGGAQRRWGDITEWVCGNVLGRGGMILHLFFFTLFTWTTGWLASRVISFSDFLSFFSPSP